MSGKRCIFAPANGQHTLQHKDDILPISQIIQTRPRPSGLSLKRRERASKK
mgnify:CR=1 FL=1